MSGTVENRRAERRANIVQQGTVLVIDDEADIRELLELSLLRMGLAVECIGSEEAAKQLLQSKRYDLCLTDMRLPDGDGLELVRFIGVQCADLPVAVITAFGSTENAVAALKAGAFDYLTEPLSLDQLRTLVKSALSLPQKTAAGKSGEAQLLGSSPGIEQVRSKIEKLARSQAPIYLTGESGSGKELAARLIHGKGSRRDPREPDGERVLWLQEGCFHGCRRRSRRIFPGCQHRHPVSGRSRRPAARDAGQAASRDPGEDCAQSRGDLRGRGRRAHHLRYAPESGCLCRIGEISAGSVRPLGGHRAENAPAARVPRRYPGARGCDSAASFRSGRQTVHAPFRRSEEGSRGLRFSRQYPRTGEHSGAGHRPHRARGNPARRSAARSADFVRSRTGSPQRQMAAAGIPGPYRKGGDPRGPRENPLQPHRRSQPLGHNVQGVALPHGTLGNPVGGARSPRRGRGARRGAAGSLAELRRAPGGRGGQVAGRAQYQPPAGSVRR